MPKLFLAPHPDDETLFGAYIIMNEKPLVAIYSSTEERNKESEAAMKILGAPVVFIKNLDQLNSLDPEIVYAPALEGGHPLHDKMHRLAKAKWGNRCAFYSTYRSGNDLLPKGRVKIPHTEEMRLKKLQALECYKSQIIATPCHFEQENKDEYLI